MSKILIGIGDSFTQGQGSIDDDTILKYGNQVFNGVHKLPIDDKEREGSWVNQICLHYLPEYTPINFGQRGRGNRSAVKELILRSEDIPEDADDIIVVYMLSGMERFDFPQKGVEFSHHHFYTMFPNPNGDGNKERRSLWSVYADQVWSDQMVVVETIMNICEAMTWCRANGAKLLLCSAFDCNITRDFFMRNLPENKRHLSDLVDWNLFWKPEQYDTIIHMLIDRQEEDKKLVEHLKNGAFFQHYNKKFPRKEWITPCAHPSRRSHKLIARALNDELVRRKYV